MFCGCENVSSTKTLFCLFISLCGEQDSQLASVLFLLNMLSFRNHVFIDMNNLLFTPHWLYKETVLLSAALQLFTLSNMTLC